jgi:hypothetical protein
VTAPSRRLQQPRKPRAVATASQSEPRQSALKSRALALCLRPPPDLLHRRRCATAPASKRPLAGLRLAGGYCVGYSASPSRCAPRLCRPRFRRPASADCWSWLALSRSVRRLRRQLRSRLRQLPQARLARYARLHPGRSGVNRKRFNITAHYPTQASRYAGLRLVAWR